MASIITLKKNVKLQIHDLFNFYELLTLFDWCITFKKASNNAFKPIILCSMEF